ncbi:replication initiator [Streptomyces sp. L7]
MERTHAGPLWRRFSTYLRREVAKRAGLSQRRFRDHARVSFAKVAEYQKRGAVHFHAVIRIDGPTGGDTSPPPWATAELLTEAIRAAAPKVNVDGPTIDGRTHTFTFGRQLDVRTIRSADFNDGQELTERAVAAYIAKYATKGAETATGAPRPPAQVRRRTRPPRHQRPCPPTHPNCLDPRRPQEPDHLRLRAWAHMLGFRGHFSTKSRRYSTTLGALRDARTEWRRAQAVATTTPTGRRPNTTYVLAHWVFAGTGLSSTEAWLAESLEPAPRNGRRAHPWLSCEP